MSIVDVVAADLSLGVGIVELLSNISQCLSVLILIYLVASQGIGDGVFKVLGLLDPGEISATKLETVYINLS